LFQDEGKLNDASTHYEQAKSHAVDDPYILGRAMYMQAGVLYEQHRLEDAKSEALRAVEIFERLGVEDDMRYCRKFLQQSGWTSTGCQGVFLEVI
jgi:outer membrane protein assembly factor BamD (BamD/ComL family)